MVEPNSPLELIDAQIYCFATIPLVDCTLYCNLVIRNSKLSFFAIVPIEVEGLRASSIDQLLQDLRCKNRTGS